VPVVVLTGTQTYNRPADWNDANNSVECISGGAGGWGYSNAPYYSAGGGGGGYARSNNATIAASNSAYVGAGGSPTGNGGDSGFNNGGWVVYAYGASVYNAGYPYAYNYVGYNGGSGSITGDGSAAGSGGGGAASRSGAGSAGTPSSSNVPGAGGASGSGASGGSAAINNNGGSGGNGTDMSGYGGGGGGGGAATNGVGAAYAAGHGGYYGGGGGGGAYGFYGNSAGGYGRQGIIVLSWVLAVPTVSNCSPSTGSADGGTSVTITGTNFNGATSVTFDGSAATSVVVVNSTTITCVTPAHAQGLVSVAVTAPGGTGSANAYRYGYMEFPAVRDAVLSSSAPTLDIEQTIWFPETVSLALSTSPPTFVIVPLSPTLIGASREILLSSTAPLVVNTGRRNIEVPPANLFTNWETPTMVRTVRNPAFDLGADLTLSRYAPSLKVTTDSVPINIVADDSEEVFIVLAD
jgi:IPT/TIG domain